jgi:hypothetical protein
MIVQLKVSLLACLIKLEGDLLSMTLYVSVLGCLLYFLR